MVAFELELIAAFPSIAQRTRFPMKLLTFWNILALVCTSLTFAEDVPALFQKMLPADQPVRAEIVVVMPPAEIEKYITKVEQAAQKDPQWFAEYSQKAKPGVPLPYHEKIGLTPQEYEEYLGHWAKREIKAVEDVKMILRKGSDGRWSIAATGSAAVISSLRFNEKADEWKSPNGTLARLPDLPADPQSILGEWTGKEWRFEEETSLSRIKESLAIGLTADKKYHYIIYRAQEMTPTGTRLLDQNLVVRLPATTPTAAR
jgi:hypothetical protein